MKNFIVDVFFYILLPGVGFGVFEQIGMSLVNLYFDKRSGIAMGIASAGTGAGIVIFSPLTNYLFGQYGYEGTCYILSAIALTGVVAGAVIIPPEAAYKLTEKIKQRIAARKATKSEPKKAACDSDTVEKNDLSKSDIENSPELNDDRKNNSIAAIAESNASLAFSTTQSTASLVSEKVTDTPVIEQQPDIKEPLSKKLCKKLKSACDFSLFRDYKFVLYTLAHILFTGCFLVPSGFMPARAVSYGISKTDASLLVSAMGIASLISRPICGFVVDIGPIKRNRMYLFIFWVTMSGALSLWSFGPTLEAQMTYAILYGIAQGLFASLLF